MRFVEAWGQVLTQNLTLKVGIISTSVCLVCLGVVAGQLALRDPLIIERGCYSKTVKSGSAAVTSEELEAFLEIALSQRFNSRAKAQGDFLSLDEMSSREQEQRQLRSRNIDQRVILNSAKAEGNNVTVDADRIVSIGSVRSVLSFPLRLTLDTGTRTDANPYGLIVVRFSEIKKEETK